MSMSATELLRLCQFAMNQLANTAIHNTGTGHHNTYDIAAELDKFLKTPPAFAKPNPWNEGTAFDALCLWEEVLENPDKYPRITQYRDENGVGATRQVILEWVEPMNTIFEAAQEDGWDAPFDWEFVPLFLEHCTNATIPVDDEAEPHVEVLTNVTPDYYTRMGSYLALLGKADHMQSMTLQSIKKTNGTGKGPAFSPAGIKKSVDI